MKQTISETVDGWMEEETYQGVFVLKVVRKNDPWHGMTEDEIEDRRILECQRIWEQYAPRDT